MCGIDGASLQDALVSFFGGGIPGLKSGAFVVDAFSIEMGRDDVFVVETTLAD